MKILLVWPSTDNRVMNALGGMFAVEPLSLEYLAAGVGNHDVKILDMRFEKGFEGLRECIAEYRPDVVGVTGYSFMANACKLVCRDVKSFDSSIVTVMGGIHATLATEDCLDENIDIVVIGEGVFPFAEIVECLERGQDLDGIKGIAIRKGDTLHHTPSRPYPNLDDLPLPNRSLTSHIRHHYHMGLWARSIATVRTTVGCPFRCDFCSLWKIPGGKYLKRSIDPVIQELLTIDEEYVFFVDDEFWLDGKRVTQLAEAIKKAGINKKYFIFQTARQIVEHPDLIPIWKAIGLSQVFIGIESVKDEGLKAMNKPSSVSVNNEALRILRENEVNCLAGLIIGLDWEEEQFKDVLSYVRQNGLVSPAFTIMTPLPGTAFHETIKDEITEHSYDLYDFGHAVAPTKMELEKFYSECEKLFNYYTDEYVLQYYRERLEALPEEELMSVIASMANYAQSMNMKDLCNDHFLHAAQPEPHTTAVG